MGDLMALNPINPGLRPLWYDAKSPAKVQLVVARNDVLHVSDDVAAQLQAADPHFKDVPADFVAPVVIDPDEVETASDAADVDADVEVE